MPQQKIRTFLWFDANAEEAANFYVSLFENSRVTQVTRAPAGGPMPAGSVLTVAFELAGIEYIGLNGGPHHTFTEAISLSVDCATQEEVDRLWERLTDGGSPIQCGWLKDRYGLCWQIVPSVLPEMLSGADPVKSQRAFVAMMGMTKLDIAGLRRAYDGM